MTCCRSLQRHIANFLCRKMSLRDRLSELRLLASDGYISSEEHGALRQAALDQYTSGSFSSAAQFASLQSNQSVSDIAMRCRKRASRGLEGRAVVGGCVVKIAGCGRDQDR